MKVACDRATLGAWDPEVRAASVKDDFELLGRGSKGNGAEI